jgi:pimeloyl-ACP methyl ester carboxylesterase
MAERWVANMVHPARRGEQALIDPILDMFARKTPATFAAQIRALLARPDAAPLLGAVDCPALVLCGREDSWSPLARHEEMARAMSGSELVAVKECGHMAPMERPREVAGAMSRWLDRCAASHAAAA